MAKKTLLCCERCGDIFEGTDGTQYCESCRNILYSNRKHALITCEICGKQFIGGAKARFCTDCNKEKYRAKQRVYARERRAKEREQEKHPIVRTFVCKDCGNEYKSTAEKSQYCDDCKQKRRNKQREFRCIDCGKTFYSTACAAARCESCRKARKQMQDNERYSGAIHYRPEPKKIPYKKPTTITEVVKAAAAMGLSYGDYVRIYGAK